MPVFTRFREIMPAFVSKSPAAGDDKDPYDTDVVRPVAKEIAKRLKIIRFMNYTTNTDMAHYKAAVRALLSALHQRSVNLKLAEMPPPPEQDTLINTIATQTKRYFIPQPRCYTGCMAFFKAQLTPEQLEAAAPVIAQSVVEVLTRQTMDRGASMLSASGGNRLFVEARTGVGGSRGASSPSLSDSVKGEPSPGLELLSLISQPVSQGQENDSLSF